MSYQVLARKWRPRTFGQVVGQAHVVRALTNALDGERVHHAFLFTGTRGVGKTTLARILAKCLNCESGVSSRPCGECGVCRELDEGRFVDLIEVDAASRAKVDETRELMDNVQFAPTRGRYKVYLIDEVHMFSEKSFNALLKTLEEPPPHVKFLLATTDPQKLPITVLSRCLQFNLKRLPAEAIAAQLERIVEQEGLVAEPPALRLIAEAADGSMRDALSLLDQASAYGQGRLQVEDARAMLGTLGVEQVHAVLGALAEGDAAALMQRVAEMAEEAVDFSDALGQVLSELQRVAVAQLVPDALDEGAPQREGVLALASRMSPEDVQLYYQIGIMGRRDLPLAPDPRGGFEMILLRMLAFRPAGGEAPARERTAEPAPAAAARAPTQARSPAASSSPPAPAAESAPAPSAPRALPFEPEAWPRLVETLPVTGLARELALNCVLEGCEGEVVRLQTTSVHAQLAVKAVQDKLQAALREYTGSRRLVLRLDVAEDVADTPADQRRRDEEQRRQEAMRALAEDPNVQAICDRFEASIDEGSVRPADR